jgi:hypothetical protein
LQELAFLATRKHKPATSQPDEEWLPCTKKDVFLAVADIRIPSNLKCVSAYLTAIRGTLLEDYINIRIHNNKYNSKRVRYCRPEFFFEVYNAKQLEHYEQIVVKGVIFNDSVSCKYNSVNKFDLTVFSSVNNLASIGNMFSISNMAAPVKCLFENLPTFEHEIIILCTRTDTGGWIRGQEVISGECVINEPGTYLLRRYSVFRSVEIDNLLLDSIDQDFIRGPIHLSVPDYCHSWQTAYHGTRQEVIPSILRDGLLKPLHTPTCGGTQYILPPRSHWPFHLELDGIKNWSNGVFVTPNEDLAARYTRGDVLLEVKVMPGSYDVYEDEWRITSSEHVIVTKLVAN